MKQPEQPTLERVLGPWAAVAVVVGTVIGSGVFLKPRAIAQDLPYPGLVAFVWVLGGLLALVGALVYAEVASVLPQAGGNYVFLREGYGRLAGWLWGWVDFWMIRSGSISALATAFTISLHEIVISDDLRRWLGLQLVGPVPDWQQRLITIGVILVLAAVNIRGVQWGSGLQIAITVVKVASLLAVALVPLFFLTTTAPGPAQPSFQRLAPAWPPSFGLALLGGIGTALLSVQWAYHGWMNIGPIAGEVRDPQRNLPFSLIVGVGIIIALYLGCNLGYYLVLDTPEIAAKGDTPTATMAAVSLLGPLGGVVVSGFIMCSVFGALNGNLLVGPRLLFAMGHDGLAPRALQSIHPEWHTPAAATAVLAVWSCLLIVGVAVLSYVGILPAGKGPFDQLTDFAMFGAVIFETMAVLAIFALRVKMPDAERPYKCPLYPFLPAAYALVPLYILVSMVLTEKSRNEALIGFAFIGAGILVYYVLGLHSTAPAGLQWEPSLTPPSAPDGAIREPSPSQFQPPTGS
jgi:amino acid transporter